MVTLNYIDSIIFWGITLSTLFANTVPPLLGFIQKYPWQIHSPSVTRLSMTCVVLHSSFKASRSNFGLNELGCWGLFSISLSYVCWHLEPTMTSSSWCLSSVPIQFWIGLEPWCTKGLILLLLALLHFKCMKHYSIWLVLKWSTTIRCVLYAHIYIYYL